MTRQNNIIDEEVIHRADKICFVDFLLNENELNNSMGDRKIIFILVPDMVSNYRMNVV